VRALRAANRNSLHEIEGRALHDLFGIAVETGNSREAGELARSAYETYGPHHPRLPHLAHDVAYWWVTQGHFARALPVLKLLRSHLNDPDNKLGLLGDLGRAAGGAGEVGTFQEAWDAATELFGSATEHTAPRAYLDFAHGALSLGKWDRAEEAAAKALEGATRRSDAKTRLTAEALLEAARRHQRAQQQQEAPALEPEVAATADALASDFVHTLSV
jgi:hypothetical protein